MIHSDFKAESFSPERRPFVGAGFQGLLIEALLSMRCAGRTAQALDRWIRRPGAAQARSRSVAILGWKDDQPPSDEQIVSLSKAVALCPSKGSGKGK